MGGSRSLSTDDPRSLTQLSPQLSFPRSCSPLTSCARRDVEREREQDFRVAVARPVTVARTILAERRIPFETEHDKRRRRQLNTRESYTAV